MAQDIHIIVCVMVDKSEVEYEPDMTNCITVKLDSLEYSVEE